MFEFEFKLDLLER